MEAGWGQANCVRNSFWRTPDLWEENQNDRALTPAGPHRRKEEGWTNSKRQRKKLPPSEREAINGVWRTLGKVQLQEWDLSLVHPLNMTQPAAVYYRRGLTACLIWIHNALALATQKPDSWSEVQLRISKFSCGQEVQSHPQSQLIRLHWQGVVLMSQTMSVGVRLRRDEIFFYSGNPMIPCLWRENLIKQCDSTVRATPACVVHVNHATPSSAVHQAGERRMHGRG